MKLILKRIDRFKQELDSLITKYSDLSYEEVADLAKSMGIEHYTLTVELKYGSNR